MGVGVLSEGFKNRKKRGENDMESWNRSSGLYMARSERYEASWLDHVLACILVIAHMVEFTPLVLCLLRGSIYFSTVILWRPQKGVGASVELG